MATLLSACCPGAVCASVMRSMSLRAEGGQQANELNSVRPSPKKRHPALPRATPQRNDLAELTIDVDGVRKKLNGTIRSQFQDLSETLTDGIRLPNGEVGAIPAGILNNGMTSARDLLTITGAEEGGLARSSEIVQEVGPHCTSTHPGAETCTSVNVNIYPEQKRAVVTLRAEVSCKNEACQLAAMKDSDYIALAAQSILHEARRLREMSLGELQENSTHARDGHAEIIDLLTHGKIIHARPNEPVSSFGHESFIVKLLDERTGKKGKALFKPHVKGNADGWHRAAVEAVAYHLNLLLGMDHVPPVVYRRGGIPINETIYEEGAFVHFVPNLTPLAQVSPDSWGVPVERLVSDTRILDVLLQNSDRHLGHFLYGEHWASPAGGEGGKGGRRMHPVLIDHAAGFREESLFVKFHGLLADAEIRGLLRRKDQILAYLDKLVKERGYLRTVMD
eukprot:jgi/Mesvir1/7908/Mv11838-RA.1